MDGDDGVAEVRLAFGDVWRLRRPGDLSAGASLSLRSDLEHHTAEDLGRRELAELAGLRTDAPATEIVARIMSLAETGWVRYRPHELPSTTLTTPVPLSEVGLGPEVFVRHALTIELFDDEDRPVPGIRYEVTLPNGAVRSGRLNTQGRAEIHGIPLPGACQVGFPDLDPGAWDYAESAPMVP